MKHKLFLLFSAFLLVLIGCSSKDATEFPSSKIELVVPSSAGGGNDRVTRSVQESLASNDLIDQDIIVANKPGGGGEVGWQYISQQKDGHTVSLSTDLILTNFIRGNSELSYEDLTPIATLTSEWMVLGVNSETGLESLDEVFSKLKEDPKSLKLAFGPSLAGDHHLLFLQAAVLEGIDPSELDIVVYGGGGEVTNALLGGHVDAVIHGVSALAEHYEAGTVNILAVSSDERIDELPDVPTFQEAGIDIVYPHWRGLVGPPDMTDEQVAYWEEKVKEMMETDSWKNFLENSGMNDLYKDSEETEKFLKEQSEIAEELLKKAKVIE